MPLITLRHAIHAVSMGGLLTFAACSGGGGGGGSTSLPDVPTGLTASDGTSADSVNVEWTGASGADTYRVFRDGVLLDEIANLVFQDIGATAGGVPSAPGSLLASDGSNPDAIELTWNAATVPDGPEHEYVVQGVNADGAGEASTSDLGYRVGFPVSGYEVQRDGVLLTTIGAEVEFSDDSAASGSAPDAPALLAATDGLHLEKVALTWSAATSQPGAVQSYSVRGTNASGAGTLTTPVNGRRAPFPILGYQVLRDSAILGSSLGLSFDDFSATPAGVPGAPVDFEATNAGFTSKVVLSWDAPDAPAGAAHEYTVRAFNAAGPGAPSNEEAGSRAGDPIDEYEVFRDGVLLATVNQSTLSLDDLTADAGGVPATPTNVAASDAQFVNRVALTWSASTVPPGDSHAYEVRAVNADGAGLVAIDDGHRAGFPVDEYQILRDGVPLVDVTSASYDDLTASAGGVLLTA